MSSLLRPNRRAVLRGGLVLAGGAAAGLLGGAPGAAALMRAGRPELTHGIQAGDATSRGATVWARADRLEQLVGEPGPVQTHQHPAPVAARQPRHRQVEQGDVVGGAVRRRPTRPRVDREHVVG